VYKEHTKLLSKDYFKCFFQHDCKIIKHVSGPIARVSREMREKGENPPLLRGRKFPPHCSAHETAIGKHSICLTFLLLAILLLATIHTFSTASKTLAM
jgi:hypothetical protein